MKTPVLNITPGTVFTYHNTPCLVLEHSQAGTLLLGTECVINSFGENNNFAESALRELLRSEERRVGKEC